MSRCDLLEKILEARFERDSASPEERRYWQERLDKLLAEALESKRTSRDELQMALRDRYSQYRLARRLAEREALRRNIR